MNSFPIPLRITARRLEKYLQVRTALQTKRLCTFPVQSRTKRYRRIVDENCSYSKVVVETLSKANGNEKMLEINGLPTEGKRVEYFMTSEYWR
jgi:hypothetical protein